jgi:glycosyltransferase involved in cell wall biosynthesis
VAVIRRELDEPTAAAVCTRPREPRVSVVVPALNEAANLPHVLPALPPVHEVILVEGGSVDGTVDTARAVLPEVRIVRQARRGKGNALAAGFAKVTGDVVVMFDADGSADPAEIPRFVEALVAGADFAKGSRFRAGGGSADITPVRRLGNRFLHTWMNLSFGTRFTDLCYGYNAFWADLIGLLDLPDHELVVPTGSPMLWGDGFEIETLINCRFASAGLTIAEVPSVERERLHGESNLRAVSDGSRVLRTLRTERTRVRRNAALDRAVLDRAVLDQTPTTT